VVADSPPQQSRDDGSEQHTDDKTRQGAQNLRIRIPSKQDRSQDRQAHRQDEYEKRRRRQSPAAQTAGDVAGHFVRMIALGTALATRRPTRFIRIRCVHTCSNAIVLQGERKSVSIHVSYVKTFAAANIRRYPTKRREHE